MKLNKTFGRIATTLVATAMLASVAAVPAFAVDNNGGVMDGSQSEAVTEIKFDKQLLLPRNVDVPSVSFNFTVTGAEPTGSETVTDNGRVVDVISGVDTIEGGSVTLQNPISFSANDTKVNLDATDVVEEYEASLEQLDVQKVVKPVSISLNSFGFEDAGVYKYQIAETDVDGITEGGTHTLYLYVERSTTNEDVYIVTGAVLKNDLNTKTDVWNNSYLLGGDPDQPIDPDDPPAVTQNEVMISKTVDGTMGNRTNQFAFTMSITSAETKSYNIVYEEKDSTGEWVVSDRSEPEWTYDDVEGEHNLTFTLAHNERLRVYGLTNEEYTVDETVANADSYVTTIKNGNTDIDTEDAPNGVTNTFEGADTTIAYTNTREAVSPTGLIMDIAPYVLLVVVAAAGCFVFLRKRRED